MTTIATLGLSVRLVVLQFLMKSTQVPPAIPPKRGSEAPPLPRVSGVQILGSTSKLDIFPFGSKLASGTSYELVDAWVNPHDDKWDMSFVRFVFCLKKHVRRDELFADFIVRRQGLEIALVDLVHQNLWATQAYMNPYFEKDGTQTGHRVLMIGCAGRVPNVQVYRDGRDQNNQGVGPKVLLSTRSSSIDLIGNDVVLVAPIPNPVSAPPVAVAA